METGNPKQLAALAVIAVGAVGYLFKGVLMRPSPTTARTLATSVATAVPKAVAATPLAFDPFSHRKLAVLKPSSGTTVPVPEKSETSPHGGGPTMRPLPLAGGFAASEGPILPAPTGVPVIVAAKRTVPKENPSSGTTIALEATAGASDAVAFLSVGGAESQPYRPNDRISGKIRLVRVEDGAVVISGPKGESTLGVGERKRI